MPDPLSGSGYTAFGALEKVFTEPFTATDYSGTERSWTAMEFAVDELNARLVADGDVARLSNPVSTQRVVKVGQVVDPKHCPAVFIVTGETLRARFAGWGALRQGEVDWTVGITTFLTQKAPAVDGETVETSMTKQGELWLAALVHALRRADGYGPWRYANDTLLTVECVGVNPKLYALDGAGNGRALQLDTSWRVGQDIYY